MHYGAALWSGKGSWPPLQCWGTAESTVSIILIFDGMIEWQHQGSVGGTGAVLETAARWLVSQTQPVPLASREREIFGTEEGFCTGWHREQVPAVGDLQQRHLLHHCLDICLLIFSHVCVPSLHCHPLYMARISGARLHVRNSIGGDRIESRGSRSKPLNTNRLSRIYYRFLLLIPPRPCRG